MKNFFLICLSLCLSVFGLTQNYDSYFTGSSTDVVTNPAGGVCLMGGATEDDNAMTWFLNQANGGDILVIRASGSDGYNNYMYSGLGVTVNSVETIVWNDAAASDEPYIHQKINQAEAIWIAGGDQWNYVSYWRDTPIDSLINKAIVERNIVIGGTSAGMAILGQAYFSAENGTVTSATALNNPYDNSVTVDTNSFLKVPNMEWSITDTHFDSPDRKGRFITFMALLFADLGFDNMRQPFGIACEEYVAVCIDTSGIARVYGEYPTYDDYAYFTQTVCGDVVNYPFLSPGQPLDWTYMVVTYKVPGNSSGSNYLDLNDWETGNGGDWFMWEVNSGTFSETSISDYECSVGTSKNDIPNITIYPNPSNGTVFIDIIDPKDILEINVVDTRGRLVSSDITLNEDHSINLDTLPAGLYYIRIIMEDQTLIQQVSIQ